MQNENFDFHIGGYHASQIYSFLNNRKKEPQYMNKRYFQAGHDQHPEVRFFIMVYDRRWFAADKLLTYLYHLKNTIAPERAPYPMIIEILQNTNLQSEHGITENVIAVVMKQNRQENFISFFDFFGENPLFNENSIKKYIIKTLEIIEYMSLNGFQNHFNPQSLFIGEDSGILQIFGYGDQEFYLTKKQKKESQLWKVAFFIFTCLKQYPPYNHPSQGEPRYKLLKQQNYEKFWKSFPLKPEISNECEKFLNLLFKPNGFPSLAAAKAHPWLQNYEQITMEEMKLQHKQQKEELKKKKKDMQKKVQQTFQKKQLNINVRGGYDCQSLLYDYYEQQEDAQRILKKGKVDKKRLDLLFIGQASDQSFEVANIFFLLDSQKNDETTRISQIGKSKQSMLRFHLTTQIFVDYVYETDVKIELFFEENVFSIRLDEVQGSLYESIWVKNYLKKLFLSVDA